MDPHFPPLPNRPIKSQSIFAFQTTIQGQMGERIPIVQMTTLRRKGESAEAPADHLFEAAAYMLALAATKSSAEYEHAIELITARAAKYQETMDAQRNVAKRIPPQKRRK